MLNIPSWLKEIDYTWTLFLDRDGVLNEQIEGDYVRSVEQLKIFDYVPVSLAMLRNKFGLTIVVTNQRGVGRGLMNEEALEEIHFHLQQKVARALGQIDKIYYCSELEDNHPMRKPQIGMALLAKNEFPEIDFSKSVMVGNSGSDIEFGRNAGMKTVFVTTTQPEEKSNNADLVVTDLKRFTEMVYEAKMRRPMEG